MSLFLSIAGDTAVPDNYCGREACGFNNAPWRASCVRCGALTARGRLDLDAVAHQANPHLDHALGGVFVKAD